MKKYLLISDFSLQANNRGTAALGFGAISFLHEKGYIDSDTVIATISLHKNPWKKGYSETKQVQGHYVNFEHFCVNIYEYLFYLKTGCLLFPTPLRRLVKNLKCVATINGGDGFSDIYGKQLYESRNYEAYIAMKSNANLIMLPQTIGPFKDAAIFESAKKIMRYASEIFVRDRKFTKEMDQMGLHYEVTKDLSSYMKPEPWSIDIKPNSVGLNVSGLAYSNKFRDLANQFDAYPILIDRIICHFRSLGHTIYLIPHAYGYNKPDENNDDMLACREVYNNLTDKTNVILLDKDLISPQVKYVISQMTFFCGTRMHANFAAIYTNVPVFGLSYSFKFEGAFNANGLDGHKQTVMINNIKESNIDEIISKIDAFYQESIKK